MPKTPSHSSFELKSKHHDGFSRAGELQESEVTLKDQKVKTDELTVKLSKLNIRNVNKKLKRRYDRQPILHRCQCDLLVH